MATGQDGANGTNVASHVEVDSKQETGYVQILNLNLEATSVKEMIH